MNNLFSSLVTGNTSSGAVANYASVDPIAGGCTLKGSLAVGSNRTDSLGKVSYLSLAFTGSLNNNIGALFSNTSLSTTVNLQLQYNFMGKHVQYHYSYFASDRSMLALKRQLIEDDYVATRQAIADGISAAPGQLRLLEQQRVVLAGRLEKVQAAYEHLNGGGADTLAKEMVTLHSELAANTRSQDSLRLVVANSFDIQNYLNRQSTLKRNKALDSLIYGAPIQGMELSWYSIAGGVGRQKYYTFNGSLPFASQIGSSVLTTGNVSVAWNWYSSDLIRHHLSYLNAGIGWRRDNNTNLYSTMRVDQTKETVNSRGDTVRTVTSEYNAYVNTIKSFDLVSGFAHFYYLYGARPGGVHLFPEIDWRSDGLVILNAGVGYIVSFLNSRRGDPAVNMEVHILFQDISNQQRTTTGFWNRNAVGVSFTLPVNLLN